MQVLTTQRFGVVEYAEQSIIRFPWGMPGFEQEKAFLLLRREAMAPLVFLQSVAREDLCFVTLPVGLIDLEYELKLSPEEEQLLGSGDRLCLAVLCVGEQTSANLLGPIVIAETAGVGLQSIRDDARYSAQHSVFESGRGESSCS